MLGLQHARSSPIPFSSQSVHVPHILPSDRGEQRDRKRVEGQLFEDVVNNFRPIVVVIYPVECIARSVDRQCWDIETFAVWGDGGNSRCDANTNVVESTQFIHHGVDFPGVHSLRIENRFRVIEDDQHFL